MRELHVASASALMRDSDCTPIDRSRGSILGRSPLVQTSFPELGFFVFVAFLYDLMLYVCYSTDVRLLCVDDHPRGGACWWTLLVPPSLGPRSIWSDPY